MAYRIWIKDEAKAEVRGLPGNMRQRVRDAIIGLGDNARPLDSLRMRVPERVALEVRRLRLDRWRIIYAVDEEWMEVGVLAVRKRPPYDYSDLDELLHELA